MTTLEEVRDALRQLENASGRLTPEAVVKAARAKNSPLNKHFEWSDSKAAHAYRLDQARELIVSITIQYPAPKSLGIVCPEYVRDPRAEAHQQGYKRVELIREDEEDARVVVVREFKVASAHLERARRIAAALDREREVEVAIHHLSRLRESFEGASAPELN